jgi:hypothetical protein
VDVVQVPADDVIGMVAVGQRGMTAPGAVLVVLTVGPARVGRSARRRIVCGNIEPVLVDVIPVYIMKVAIVEVVVMAIVLQLRVPTTHCVLVTVALVRLASAHSVLLAHTSIGSDGLA